MSDLMRTAAALIEQAKDRATESRSQLEEVQLFPGFAEPGYEGVVAIGNWNKVGTDTTPETLGQALEALGVETEWSDLWDTCCHCNLPVRTDPDMLGWRKNFVDIGSERICGGCLLKEEDWIHEYIKTLIGNPAAFLFHRLDITKYGYVKLDVIFDAGCREGPKDDPYEVAKALRGQGITRFVFGIKEVNSFDLDYEVYVHNRQAKRFDKETFKPRKKPCPAESLKAACKVPVKAGPGDTILMRQKPDGTYETKVGPQAEILNEYRKTS